MILFGQNCIARLQSRSPHNIVRYIGEMGLQVQTSYKDDIIAYQAGTSKELIDQVIEICNKTLLPGEAEEQKQEAERQKRREEQEKAEKKRMAELEKQITNATEMIQRTPNDANCYQLFYDEASNEAENKGKSYKARRMESIQNKLINDVSGDIQAAFDELKKHQ